MEKISKIAVISALVCSTAPAYATTAVAETTTIDFSTLAAAAVTFAVAAVGILATWGVRYLNKKLGTEGLIQDAEIRKYLDAALSNATKYGVNKIEKADWTKLETKNAALANAATYAIDKVPQALDHFGVTQDQLIDMLEAKLLDHDKNPGQWAPSEVDEVEAK